MGGGVLRGVELPEDDPDADWLGYALKETASNLRRLFREAEDIKPGLGKELADLIARDIDWLRTVKPR